MRPFDGWVEWTAGDLISFIHITISAHCGIAGPLITHAPLNARVDTVLPNHIDLGVAVDLNLVVTIEGQCTRENITAISHGIIDLAIANDEGLAGLDIHPIKANARRHVSGTVREDLNFAILRSHIRGIIGRIVQFDGLIIPAAFDVLTEDDEEVAISFAFYTSPFFTFKALITPDLFIAFAVVARIIITGPADVFLSRSTEHSITVGHAVVVGGVITGITAV